MPHFESSLQNAIVLFRDERSSDQKREAAHLRVFLNACSLIPNARLVHLRSDYLEQVESIVDARSRETLDLWGSISALAGALRSKIRVGELASRIDGTRTRRLGLRLLRACLRCGFLCAQNLRRLLLCKQPRVLGFALEL